MKDSWERKEFDKRLGRELQKGIDEIPWSEQQELEGLRAVHAAMEGRRMTMRFQGRKMVAAAAVILALTEMRKLLQQQEDSRVYQILIWKKLPGVGLLMPQVFAMC